MQFSAAAANWGALVTPFIADADGALTGWLPFYSDSHVGESVPAVVLCGLIAPADSAVCRVSGSDSLKLFRCVATRYDELGANFFAFVRLASVRVWLRSIQSTA